MPWNLGPQSLDWASPSRIFATTTELFDSMPNYEHEIAIALDTRIKYQGYQPVVAGWAYATGELVPGQPPGILPPTNDQFTVMMLSFDDVEGNITPRDTNFNGWPRKWTRHGFAGFSTITNVNDLFYPGSLKLDGRSVWTAPDENRLDFGDGDFTVRGHFLCDFPIGGPLFSRIIIAKGNEIDGNLIDGKIQFVVGMSGSGNIITQGTTIGTANLLDRNGIQITDRNDVDILTRFPMETSISSHTLVSTSAFSDVFNTGWHSFTYSRQGPTLSLAIDGVVEATGGVSTEFFMKLPGRLTISGFGPPRNGVYQGGPWSGGLDRLGIDIGIGR